MQTTAIAILAITTSLAPAGGGGETMGSGLWVILFLGLGALIVIFQLIPSLVLFGSMMKGLFGKGEEGAKRIVAPSSELGLTMADGGRRVAKAEGDPMPPMEEKSSD